MPALARGCVASGSTGAVAAGSRTAAAVGAAALLDGGNAFDAAVAAALVETVALPSKCGLAGDLVALLVPAGADAPVSLVALGGAGAGLHDAAAAASWQVPPTGSLSIGVPGAPAGYAALAARGRLPLDRLAAPAIALARRGVWWSPMNALLESEARALLATYQPDGCRFSPAEGPHEVGAVVRLPGLARVLEELVVRGAGLFHDGPVAEALLATVRRHGGVLTADDLRTARADEGPAVSADVAKDVVAPGDTQRTLWATHAPSYGVALVDVFAQHPPATVGPPEVRASLQALARGDLGTDSAPLVPAPVGDEGTSTVAAVDADGNSVVVVHSNSFPQYGSGIVVDDHDLVLSNRAGRGFTFAPGHPNSPLAGRRPLTTLHAWGVRHPDGWLLGATPGGQQQVPWNAQVLALLLAGPRTLGDDAIGAALTGPRWLLGPDGGVRHEGRDLDPFTARSSHTLVRSSPGRVTAAADPRWDSTAVAV